jgi:hypothetical protein
MPNEGDEFEIKIIRNENCPVMHVDGAYGTLNPTVGQLSFFYDIPKITMGKDGEMKIDSIERVIAFDARMSPETFRSIAYWMIEHVKLYESWLEQQMKDKGKK